MQKEDEMKKVTVRFGDGPLTALKRVLGSKADLLPLHNGEENVGVPWSPYAGAEMCHEHLLQLFK